MIVFIMMNLYIYTSKTQDKSYFRDKADHAEKTRNKYKKRTVTTTPLFCNDQSRGRHDKEEEEEESIVQHSSK